MTPALGSLTPLLGAAAKKSSGNATLLIIVAIGVLFYLFIYRPQQKKQKAARAQVNLFDVGDEVVTAGGIVGRVLDVTDDRVILETSVGASFTVLKPYVLRKLEPAAAPPDVVGDDEHDEHEHDGDDEHEHDHVGDEHDHVGDEHDQEQETTDGRDEDQEHETSDGDDDEPAHETSDTGDDGPGDGPTGKDAGGADAPPTT